MANCVQISNSCQVLLAFGLMLILIPKFTNGHGALLFPPGRSTAWRLGYPTLVNYDDAELNCGGFGVRNHNHFNISMNFS